MVPRQLPVRIRDSRLNWTSVDVDGGGLRRLTLVHDHARTGFSSVPDWSPDGRKFVFAKQVERSGAPCRPAGRCNDEIYVSTPRHRPRGGSRGRGARGAGPSVTGRKEDRVLRGRDGPAWNMYVMNADGSGQRKLTQTPRRQGERASSPDGEKIAVSRTSRPSRSRGRVHDQRRRQRHPERDERHDDGSTWPRRPTSGRSRTWKVRSWAQGCAVRRRRRRHRKRRVSRPLSGRHGEPVLVVRRAALAFTGVGGTIYTVHADGGGLASSPAPPPAGPQWSPNGRKIAFNQ